MTNTKQRNLYFDILRICATFMVVLLHCCTKSLLNRQIDSYWHILNVFESFCRCAVPTFFMISGALFLNQSRSLSVKNLYKKNILRLCTAFAFWSAVYVLLSAYIKHKFIPGDLFINFVKGHYHMWFIPAMIGIYILLPLLRKIAENPKLVGYFLLICLVLRYIPAFVVAVTELLPFSEAQTLSTAVTKVFSSLKFYSARGYVFYFFLGHYLHTKDFTKVQKLISALLGFAGTIGIIMLTACVSLKKGRLDESFYDYTTLLVFLQAQGVFVLFKSAEKIKVSDKISSFIQNLSKYTFGCYLIHLIFITLYEKYILADSIYPPLVYISIPVLAIAVFALSMAVSAVLNHIPFIKKYIV